MTIDLSQVHTLFLVVLPALVGVLAGLIRQDKLPNWLNELILYIIVAVVALVQALLDGKLGGNALSDFMLVGAYCTAFLNTAPGRNLLGSVQTVTSIGGHPATVTPVQPFDLGALAGQIAPFLAQELVKLRMASVVPTVQHSQAAQMPVQQQPMPFSTPVPQPPYSHTVTNHGPQVYGVNSGPPGTATIMGNAVLTDPTQIYNLATQSVQAVTPQGWTQVPQSGQSG